jgi:UDP-N-acetylmuramoylalanine--D-glutamate ligase
MMSRSLGQQINTWTDLFALRDQSVHVVGAGSVEGAHLLLFLMDHGFKRLVGHDFADAAKFGRAFKRVHVGWPAAQREEMLQRLRAGADLRYRDRYLEGIEDANAIAVTQGWYLYPANQQLIDSSELQTRFLSLMQLYLALAPGPVIGISGSQGKSTTTALLVDMLRADGREVIHAGNERHSRQALDLLEKATAEAHLVLEVSNRHLKMLDRSPRVAVVTNVYPNHLDEHAGWDGYVDAKARMVRYQEDKGIAVLNANQEATRNMALLTPARVVWFGDEVMRGVSADDTALTARNMDRDLVLRLSDLQLPGKHNAMNLAAAAAAALAMGARPEAIAAAAGAFRGLKHRLQFTWEHDGVRYYDDLNSTTPTATVAGLLSLDRPVVWILGGADKGLSARELAEVAHDKVHLALALPGEGSNEIVSELERQQVLVQWVGDLGAAVRRAVEVAAPGDAVLLSPACPGFFSRFYVGVDEDTGFRKLVRQETLQRGSHGSATSPPARKPRRSVDPR